MLAVIRIRGSVNVWKEFKDTMKIMRLKTVNNCVVVPDNDSYMGMVMKVKDYVTFGEINLKTFVAMLKKRGRIEGDKRLDENSVSATGYKTVEELAKAIFEGSVNIRKVPKLKPVFRLTPPSKGFKSTKTQFPKGDLGYRGKEINELIMRMI
jgi:large subunit ribosomal protein L30